jgi:outer membrane protein
MFKVSIVIALVALGAANVYVLFFREVPRIAYVRSYELIEKYAGTIEARAGFEKKKVAMVGNVDSLRMHIEKSALEYNSKAGGMNATQRKEREDELNLLQKQFYQYSSAIEGKIQEEDQEMMAAVLNQVNSFVEEYAKENDYDIIMGTTLSGSLLYGEAALDVTEDVIGKLNLRYNGKSK